MACWLATPVPSHVLLTPMIRSAMIVPFFKHLESDREVSEKLHDYFISQTTLEEVFMNVS